MKKAIISLFCGALLALTGTTAWATTLAHWNFGGATPLVSSGSIAGLDLQYGVNAAGYAAPEWNDKGGKMGMVFSNTSSPTFQTMTLVDQSKAALLSTNTFTIEAYINLNSLPASGFSTTSPYTVLSLTNFANNSAGGLNYMVRINTTASGTFAELVYQDTANKNVSLVSTVNLSADTWYYIGVTRDSAGLITLYVDHDSNTKSTSADPTAITTGFLTVGSAKNSGTGVNNFQRGFDGAISEIRISDVALSADQLLINIPEPAQAGLMLGLMALAGVVARRRALR